MDIIIVKGMKMPERCADCLLCDMSRGTKCRVTGDTYWDKKGYPYGGNADRPAWCPLTALPEKYGGLIDADEAE